jgi:RNA polymerase sigma-70 factor, ECF subfamily
MTSSEEEAIIMECRRGDLQRFAALYDAYVEKIGAFIYYRTLHRETAEDLTSDVFLKAFEKIGTFSPDKGSFSSWIYRIARNAVIDHYRTTKNETDVDSVPGLSSRTDIERDASVRESFAKIEAHLANVKPQQREILVMRLWDGLSHAEIAEITGLTEDNCKMIFSRAIRRLRDDLGPMAVLLLILTATVLWPH